MAVQASFESLLAEAEAHPFKGWDFSWIKERIITRPLPWNYAELVLKHTQSSPDLLDLGTGGGEFLASLAHRPGRTVATEAYPPNVPIAARRLHPVGVALVQVEGAPDNNVQKSGESTALPFKNSSFHLIINRHESYVAREISRLLVSNGHYVTQQVGEQRYHDFHRLLKKSKPRRPRRPWDLKLAKEQLEDAGLRVTDSGRGVELISFMDIGAFAWYLKSVPWIINSFSIPTYRDRLRELHLKIKKEGPLVVQLSRFWLEAVKKPLGPDPLIPLGKEGD